MPQHPTCSVHAKQSSLSVDSLALDTSSMSLNPKAALTSPRPDSLFLPLPGIQICQSGFRTVRKWGWIDTFQHSIRNRSGQRWAFPMASADCSTKALGATRCIIYPRLAESLVFSSFSSSKVSVIPSYSLSPRRILVSMSNWDQA